MTDRKWLNGINFECLKCKSRMEYVGNDIFECKCGFKISVNEDFTWATIERESCQVVK